MPLPAILGAILPAVASIGANAIGGMMAGREEAENTEAAIKARNKATKQELKRQNKYNRKAADVFTDSLALFRPNRVDRMMDKADDQATGLVIDNMPVNFGSIGSGLAPPTAAADEKQFAALANRENVRHGLSLGQLLSHDQYLTLTNRALDKRTHDLNRISDFARGSANVNAIEQAVAGGNAQQPPSIWGPVLQTAGTIGAHLAGQGGFPGFSLPTKPLIPAGAA